MRDTTAVPAIVGDWFRRHREQYRWPETTTREQSEKRINELAELVKSGLLDRDADALKDALVKIHRWKSRRTANRYEKSLANFDSEYFKQLLVVSACNDTGDLEQVIRHLKKTDYCNLPVCTAIASFLYGRQNVPIIDNYVAQFFARRFNVHRYDDEMSAVLGWTNTIDFKLETNGKKHRKLRLAVYNNQSRFEDNLRKYIDEFVPECQRIANALNAGGYSYSDIDGISRKFTAVDVEMSIFSWCVKNKRIADVMPTEHSYIVRKDGILSWEPIVKGTRTPVRAIVENSRLGYTPEKILEALPHLSLEAIHDALSYYKHHTEEIERHIERNKVPDHLIHPSVRDL